MKKNIFIVGILIYVCIPAAAQEFFVGADIVSNYIWRGSKSGNAAIQPDMGVTLGGLTIGAWGSTEFREENNSLDLTITYQLKKLTLYLSDMYNQIDDEESNYFNHSSRTTGHVLDAGLIYTLSEKTPLSLAWYTSVAGNDFKDNDKRAWSTYIQLNYPFTVGDFNLEPELGITPWNGTYADKLNIVNLSLKITKEMKVSDSFTLPLFGQVGVNPYEKMSYFVVGITL